MSIARRRRCFIPGFAYSVLIVVCWWAVGGCRTDEGGLGPWATPPPRETPPTTPTPIPTPTSTPIIQTFQDTFGNIPATAEERGDIEEVDPRAGGVVLTQEVVDLSVYLNPAEDQGDSAACVGFAIAALKTIHEARECGITAEDPEIESLRFDGHAIYSEIQRGGRLGGATISDGLAYVEQHGAPIAGDGFAESPADQSEESGAGDYTPATFKIDTWGLIPENKLSQVKLSLRGGEPVLLGITIYPQWVELRTAGNNSVYQSAEGNEIASHAVLAVGFDETREAVKVRNSRGPDWGDGGYAWIPYDNWDAVVQDVYAAVDSVDESKGICPNSPALPLTADTEEAFVGPAGIEVILAASASGGTAPYAFSWVKLSGPSGAMLYDALAASARFTPLSTGDYQFRVTVSDDDGQVATDTVTVTVFDDCNSNGLDDISEMVSSPQSDCDGSGMLDECEFAPRTALYWGDSARQQIYRMLLPDGEPQEILSGVGDVRDVAVDVAAGRVYWTASGDHAIQWTHLSGGERGKLAPGYGDPVGLDIDLVGRHLYWTDRSTGSIRRIDLDSSRVETVVEGLDSPEDVAADAGAGVLYWVDEGDDGGHSLRRARIGDASESEELITGLDSPQRLFLDVAGGSLYWTDNSDDSVHRSGLDGNNREIVVSQLISPCGVAVEPESGDIYWADWLSDTIDRVGRDGTERRTIAGDLASPTGIALVALRSGDCDDNGILDICDLADGTAEDCNNNGIPDQCDVAVGLSRDCDGNNVPDECSPPVCFSEAQTIYTGDTPFKLAVAELNGDSYIDIVVSEGDENSRTTVLVNDGFGGFSARSWPVGSIPDEVEPMDVDRDGRTDLVVIDRSLNVAHILRNLGQAVFEEAGSVSVGGLPRSIDSGDFDGDEYDDAVVASVHSGGFLVLMNDRQGGFAEAEQYDAGEGVLAVEVGDLDGDDKPDVGVLCYSTMMLRLHRNNGEGSFLFMGEINTAMTTWSFVFVDLDNDDDLDVSFALDGDPGGILVAYNDGQGSFGPLVSAASTYAAWDLVASDVNGDGYADLVTDAGTGALDVITRDSAGAFLSNPLSGKAYGAAIAAADVDRDGDVDLISTAHNVNDVVVFYNELVPN